MKSAANLDYAARYELVNLLSDKDIGGTSVSYSLVYVARGDLYLDLEHSELGVQQATTSEQISVGRILPRNAVSERTWNTILGLLAARTPNPPLRLGAAHDAQQRESRG